MLKPKSLAAALAGVVPDLITDPDRFRCYVERGRLVARATPALGFEYRYQLTLFLLSYEGEADAILFPLLEWMRANQPEQFLNEDLRGDAIRFEVDLLDDKRCDISIELQLTETVTVTQKEDGGYQLEHLEEPGPIDGDPTGVLRELWMEQPPADADRILPLD